MQCPGTDKRKTQSGKSEKGEWAHSSWFKLTLLCAWKGWCLQVVVLRFLLKQMTLMDYESICEDWKLMMLSSGLVFAEICPCDGEMISDCS